MSTIPIKKNVREEVCSMSFEDTTVSILIVTKENSTTGGKVSSFQQQMGELGRTIEVTSWPDQAVIVFKRGDKSREVELTSQEFRLLWLMLVRLRKDNAFGDMPEHLGGIVMRGGPLGPMIG